MQKTNKPTYGALKAQYDGSMRALTKVMAEHSEMYGVAKELAEAAASVMQHLERHGPSIVPHLMDTDENAGQRLRAALTHYRAVMLEGPDA